ncbi:MAG: C4-dicarboxylate ABC transporter substrate-binding protein, partial [Rhodobacteraceae bacterium]|nr:C4-dicarboxylate ABC transporter substrate-binding protein [Paracoccaceae bacterium]
DHVVTAMNADKWNGLSADDQTLIKEQISANFEEPAWASAQDALVNDIACLTGNGDCASGESRDMTLVAISDADFEKARGILIGNVLPDWASRAGGDWAARWNASVGQTVGVTIE